jgi:glycosyltransferase involved in cell wall biosynthesis
VTHDVHVVHVINRLSPTGGAEVSLVQLLPHLGHAGICNTVVTVLRHTSGSRVSEVRSSGTEVVCLDAPGPVGATARLADILPDLRPDLVHTTLFDAGLAGRVAARVRGIPAVTSVVNTVYAPDVGAPYGHPLKRRVVELVDRQLAQHATAAVHALTDFAASAAQAELGVNPRSITVIPRGRDRAVLGAPSPQRRAAARRALGLDAGQPVVLAVGRQERQKAQDLLIEAFSDVLEKHRDAALLIAGRRGANSSRVEDAVARAGFPDGSVRILGPRDDVPDLLCAADVFALPSMWEGLGGVVLEAMAMDVPVVSFSLPPVLEVLGGAGVTVPRADVAGLAEAIIALLDDPERRLRLAGAARERFEEHYRIEVVARRMADWYRSLASGRS